jgi:hypothetical protein
VFKNSTYHIKYPLSGKNLTLKSLKRAALTLGATVEIRLKTTDVVNKKTKAVTSKPTKKRKINSSLPKQDFEGGEKYHVGWTKAQPTLH